MNNIKSPLTIPHFLTPPSTEVSHFLATDTQLVECVGANPSYKLGELWKDTGYIILGAQIRANKTIGGLFYFVQSNLVTKMLATLNDAAGTGTELWYSNGAGWTQITVTPWASSPSMRVEMESFLGHCFFVGSSTGVTFLPVGTLNGTTFSTTANCVGMPQAKYITRFRDRVYVANTSLNITTTLNGNISIGDTSITVVDTSRFPSSGTLTTIGTNTNVTYTGKTATTFTGIPATGDGSITAAALSGVTVRLGSTTPTPYRVYFSRIPVNGTTYWQSDTDFFEVDFSEEIIGISSNWDRLMIFTDQNTYMYDGQQLKKVFQTGCVNQRTIKNMDAYMVWMAPDNVYASISGGRPQPIGTDILQLIRNSAELDFIPDDNKLSAEIAWQEYNLYLGATSANGISYTNCLATFNFDRGMWRWRELATAPTSMAWSKVVAGKTFVYFGNNNGQVFRKGLPNSQIYTDNGTAIRSRFRTKAFDLGSPEILKAVTRIISYCRKAGGLELRFRVFDKQTEKDMPFTSLGTLTKCVNILDKRLDGHFIQFEGIEMGGTEGWVFNGLTLLAGVSSHQS